MASLFSGTLGAVLPRHFGDRQFFAYALAGPGFGLAWICGFALAALEEIPVVSTWVIGAMILSLASLQVVLYAVGKDGRRSPVVTVLAILPLVLTVVLMVYRP